MTNMPETNTDALRKELIREERRRYTERRGKSYNWEEVRQMAHNKDQRKNKALEQEIALYLPHLNVRQKRVVLVLVKAFASKK